MEEELRCTYAKGEPASSLRSQTRKERWGGMGGRQRRCGWLFDCGWNEQRKVGERHRGVRGTNKDNREKPGHTYSPVDSVD